MLLSIFTDDQEQAEAFERREAELQFVESAYSTEECWIDSVGERGSHITGVVHVKRRLLLSPQLTAAQKHEKHLAGLFDGESKVTIVIIVTLSLPQGYPVIDSSVVQIEASLSFLGNTLPAVQKVAINALPSLLAVCRIEASNNAGCEALFSILSCADSWVEHDWRDILITAFSTSNMTTQPAVVVRSSTPLQAENENTRCIMGRRLIHSHHIIAKSKRKSLKDLASDYELGGYVKIGWPGIIIIEGLDSNCERFIHEIKGMKWQYLNIRGEQQIDFESMEALKEARVFLCELVELDQDQMSTLASLCHDRGLTSLFKSCMKIYENSDEPSVSDELATKRPGEMSVTSLYGALVLVNHMNDLGYYTKWLHKATKSAGCAVLIKCLKRLDPDEIQSSSRNVTVILVGSVEAVKQVIKLWRASRVDVDTRSRPCFERMMSILMQGPLTKLDCNGAKPTCLSDTAASHRSCVELFVDFNVLKTIVFDYGDKVWCDAWTEAIRN